jgi:Peptidase family M28
MAMRLLLRCKIGIFLGNASYACIFGGGRKSGQKLGRIVALAALVAGIWLLSAYGQSRPQALGLDAPAGQFSAARADLVLGRVLGDQRPHPVGSAAAQAVRGRILQELAALGVAARTQTGMSCTSEPRWNTMPCGTVTNIIAEVSPGHTKASAIVLMAHSDSVPAGPGAGDDGSGVAILLETIRALKARNAAASAIHPIVALFTDGEEPGLLGAAFYLRDPAARARIGAVINVEARGNQGPSYLFQTSAGNGKLIDLYARSLTQFSASSLYGEIYKYLPNDTDLTPMLGLGVPAANFSFIGNVAHYHTPLDRRENIDRRSLQQQGDAATALSDALSHVDLARLKGRDAIYLDVLGRWLPRLPLGWALPLSLAVFVAIALAGFWTPRERHALPRPILAAVVPPLLLAACVGLGFVLHALAAWLSGHADPSFAYPTALRLALGCGVFAIAVVAARGASAIAIWLWFAALAIACALLAPGVTPYFLFPALVAAPLLLATVRGGRDIALFVAALAALLVWIGLNQGSEALMGLQMHPLFTVSAAFALLPLLPLLKPARAWKPSAALLLGLALVLGTVAGFQPAYSARAPELLNLRYVENEGKAFWLADPVTHLPDKLRAAAKFSLQPQRVVERGYVAPAGPARNLAPAALVSRRGDKVTLDLKTAGDAILLAVPAQARLQSVTIGGVTTAVSARRMSIICATPDCATARLMLRLASSKSVELLLVALRQGLPRDGEKLLKARPPEAVPSQMGDSTMLAAKIAILGR